MVITIIFITIFRYYLDKGRLSKYSHSFEFTSVGRSSRRSAKGNITIKNPIWRKRNWRCVLVTVKTVGAQEKRKRKKKQNERLQ